MAWQRNPFRGTMGQFRWEALNRPALPQPRLTADVYETADGNGYVVEVPVPGMRPDEITIEATSDALTVSTRPSQEEAKSDRSYIQRGQSLEPMSRVIEFPVEIDVDHVEAKLEHGMLKIQVPKAAASRRSVIKVDRAA